MKENLGKVKKAYDITGEDFYLVAAEKGFAQIADELICLSKNLLDKLLPSRGYWGRH